MHVLPIPVEEPEIRHELLPKAPPVLWFGNNLTKKEKIVTIGANPSAYNFKASTENGLTSSANYWIFPYKQFKIIGLSVNLGNPKGFSKKTLNEFGKAISKKINPA